MRAIVITRAGGPDVLVLRDVAAPEPGPRQIRVRVHATAVNRADLLQRAGNYPAPTDVPQDIPGLEYAGTVEGLGAGVTRWIEGDRVMGLVGGGGYSEYIITHEDEALPVPASLSLTEAAAVPEAFITAHDALITRMQLRPGESLLIHAVGSGVGTAALQLAKAHDAFVLGTQRSAWKLERARSLGLDVPILAEAADFADQVMRRMSERSDADEQPGVHGILDLVGGGYLAGNLRAIRELGRIIVVGLVAGAKSELDMRLLLRKRATLVGTVLRARSLEEKIDAVHAFTRDVMPLLDAGSVKPVIDEVLPLAQAARAHEMVEGNGTYGKVVLEIGS
ncbi:MAG TPA: NAD(P)H-quinone oxidoreductase [Longimicrobiales bacterium]|nr:NAD(P)H-quinone oxidoreductase [Longimicrobiales bacterium]